MKTTQQLADRFREVLLNGTFIAYTNYKNELENLNWKLAVHKIENLNTIADLARHIHYYIGGINEVFRGGNLEIKDKFSFDFPPIQNWEEWISFLNKFWRDAEEFAGFVEKLPDEKLHEDFVEAKYGNYHRNIDAMIEHAYYHLGQIVLIKKLLASQFESNA